MSQSGFSGLFVRSSQALAFFVIVFAAAGLVAYSLLCVLQMAPWLTMSASFGDTTFPNAGIAVQLAVTVLFASLIFFVPAANRVMALERSHRQFQVSMNDVMKAYYACHAADRAGVFTLSSEFDQVRERLQFMRDHPNLRELQGDVLTLAAQMSQQARQLADIYSDEQVQRARSFLQERQAEAEQQQEHILEAMRITREIKDWMAQVEVEESVVANQLAQLDDQLQAVLPALGYGFEEEEETNVVQMPTNKPAAE